MDTNFQSLSSKQGEINYRSKLSLQYLKKKTYFPNEPNQKQIISALKQRISSAKKDFNYLKKLGVKFTPYIEIGAEFSHRAMLLESKYKANGFAVDLSLESLELANFFTKHLNLKKIPTRICADAYNLPFPDNSMNLIFCYQTLHHFPNPKQIIKEMYRVLKPCGYFFVNEEPVSQTFNLNFWRRPTKLRSWEKFLKKILILPFISRIGRTETEHGILEETFGLKTWQRSLESFENATVWIKPYPFGPQSKIIKGTKKNWLKPQLATRALITIAGGGIKVLSRKGGHISESNNINISDLIVCPNCKIKLKNTKCLNCNFKYPILKGIPILISPQTLKTLYPKVNVY
ncbi:MAG: Methyltransferase type 11 [Parcubacteria group bacterium GW2011_GWA1_36_12]|nr:MAG: Methyltransferase type 11 [Parcubacteria group bacterium GW2011_GWA1_36_12]